MPSMKRRTMILAGMGLALPAIGARAQALENTLVVRTTGGVFEAALKRNFFDPFTRATGTRIVPVATSYGEMIAKTVAMHKANAVEWDIISPQIFELENLSEYLLDLGDCGQMPNVAAQGVPGACVRWGVHYLTGGNVLTWNTETLRDKAPRSWADFWDVQKFPGRRALPSYGNPWNNSLALALLADGVAPANLFPMDLDRAFRKLDEIKPHIAVWWKTGAQSQQILRSGEVDMTMMWSGTAFATKRAGVPIAWTYTQAIADLAAWAILRGAPHPNAAKAFIKFYMTNPEAHAAFSREMGYATSNKGGLALLPPETSNELVSTPEALAGLVRMDANWVEANRAATLDRWNRWIAA